MALGRISGEMLEQNLNLTGNLTFNGDALTIASDGKIGIKNTSPGVELDVTGTARANTLTVLGDLSMEWTISMDAQDTLNFAYNNNLTMSLATDGALLLNGIGLDTIGSGQKLITASDNFAAGDIVVYDNGSYVKATFSGTSGLSASATDSNSLATDPYFAANVIYDQVTDRYVVFRSNGGALYAVVAQATSTGFTLGIELQFYMYAGSINITNELSVTIDKNANKIICAWVGQGQNYADGGLRVAAFEIDPATNTITMGNIAADTDQPNINNVSIGYDTDTGKFLIICNYSTDVRCYAGYVDGQNIVLGTRQSLTVSGGPTWFGIAYDQTAQRFFVGHNANGRVAAVAQINSDNSITFGAWTTIPNQNTPGNPYYKTSEGKIYLPYISNNFKASLGEVTIDNVANTLTFNTVEFTATSDVLGLGMVYLELIDQFYFYYKKFPYAGGEEYIADVVFNNGTPSLANSIETSNMFNYTQAEQYKATVGIDRVVSTYGTGPAYLTYSTFASINSNASSWIGIAAEDIADTATGLIDLSGAINRSQAGLVKDTVYYVNQLGSLTTTPTTFGMIGKAISTTDLQIFGNAVIELSKAIDVDFTTNTPTTTSGLVLTSDGDSTYSFQLAKEVKETVQIIAPAATVDLDTKDDQIFYQTSDSTQNWTINVRGDATTTLNSYLANNESITVVYMATQGATAYYSTQLQIDGVNVTPVWSFGNAPIAGTASAIDVYSYTITKTADATYTVLANASFYQ